MVGEPHAMRVLLLLGVLFFFFEARKLQGLTYIVACMLLELFQTTTVNTKQKQDTEKKLSQPM
jgi:hypothetical protein